MTSADSPIAATAGPRDGRAAWWVAASVVATTALLVAVAWWMTGPAPKPIDDGADTAPPSLALPAGVSQDSPLAKAAASLAGGDLDTARTRFSDVVADDPQSEAGQVGLVLTGWRRVGALAVQRDLEQLLREYPSSAYVEAHLALVQSLRGDARGARTTLHQARTDGWAADDATGLRMAGIADGLLHPSSFPGYIPVLVTPDEVPAADRARVTAMLADVARGSRPAAAEAATALAGSTASLTRVAAAAAAFDKDQPDAAVAALQTIATSAGRDRAGADRARLVGALALVWDGSQAHRTRSCTVLRGLAAAAATDAGTRRLAAPLVRATCS